MEVAYGSPKSPPFSSVGPERVTNVCEQVGLSSVNNEKNFEHFRS